MPNPWILGEQRCCCMNDVAHGEEDEGICERLATHESNGFLPVCDECDGPPKELEQTHPLPKGLIERFGS
jgi:hypothetical protein